jgi:hypothetical protein
LVVKLVVSLVLLKKKWDIHVIIIIMEHSLATHQFVAILLQTISWQLIRLSMYTFSHMTYLMSHVICLNNTRELYYELIIKKKKNGIMSCHVMGCSKIVTKCFLS